MTQQIVGSSQASTIGGDGQSNFRPVIERPVPTGRIVTVNSTTAPATIASNYAAAGYGDCIEFDDGVYDHDACFPNGFNRAGVIVRAKNRGSYDADPMGDGGTIHWARFRRMVTFESGRLLGGVANGARPNVISADDVTIHDISFTRRADLWPEAGTDWNAITQRQNTPWGYLMVAAGVNNPRILYNEFATGHGTDRAPYDIASTTRLPDMKSPSVWYFISNADGGGITDVPNGTRAFQGHGDADWVRYNRIFRGPNGIVAIGEGPNRNSTIYANYFHDLARGIGGIMAASGVDLRQHNWMERIYQDYNTMGAVARTYTATALVLQEVWLDPFGDTRDNGNPHADTNQVFWSNRGSGAIRPRLMQSSRNMLGATSAMVRGSAQLNFWHLFGRSSNNDVIAYAPKLRENIALMTGSIYAGEIGPHEDGYVRANETWHPDPLANGRSSTTVYILERQTEGIVARSSKTLFADNLVESLRNEAEIPVPRDMINNAGMGPRSSRTIFENQIFQDPGTWPTTLNRMFEYRRNKKQPYQGIGVQTSTVAEHLLGELDWTGERPYAGFVDIRDADASTVISSNPAWVHGGNPGDTLGIVPGNGVEWRTLSITDRETPNRDWTSQNGCVVVDGEYLQLRTTSPIQGVSTERSIKLGGTSVIWRVTSASTARYPTVVFDPQDQFRRGGPSGSTTAIGRNSSKMTFATRLRFRAVRPAGSTFLLGTATGGIAPVRVLITGAGLANIALSNANGTIIGSFSLATRDLYDGRSHEILVAADVSQSAAAAGITAYVDGVEADLVSVVWNGGPGVEIGYARAGATYAFQVPRAADDQSNANVSFVYLDIAERADLARSAVRDRFNADRIGTDGSAITGGVPALFLVGNAEQWNDRTNGLNRGSGLKWFPTSATTVADGSSGQAPWG